MYKYSIVIDNPYEPSFNFSADSQTLDQAFEFVSRWMKEYEKGYALDKSLSLGRYFFKQTVDGDVVWNADGSVDRVWVWVNPEWSVRIYEV